MSCKPTYKGKRYNSLEELYRANNAKMPNDIFNKEEVVEDTQVKTTETKSKDTTITSKIKSLDLYTEEYNDIYDIFGDNVNDIEVVDELDGFAEYNTRTKIISINKKLLKEEFKHRYLVHELIHAKIEVMPNKKELREALKDFRNNLKSNTLLQTKLNSLNETDKNIITSILNKIENDNDIDELVTYALTNKTFASFLSNIPTDDSVTTSESLWTKLANIIINSFKNILPNNKLNELVNILNNIENTSINLETKAENSNINIIKSGIDEVFKNIPELYNIGTLKQYNDYLDIVFPDSKIKDIVYHGSQNKNIETFSKNFIGTTRSGGKSRLSFGEGFYFSPTKIGANEYAETDTDEGVQFTGKVYSVILNNPKLDLLPNGKPFQLVVENPEQIHILGSNKDIEGFKQYINNINLETKVETKQDQTTINTTNTKSKVNRNRKSAEFKDNNISNEEVLNRIKQCE